MCHNEVVAIGSDKGLKPFTHASAQDAYAPRVPIRGSSKRLFSFLSNDSRYVTGPAWADKSGNTGTRYTPSFVRPNLFEVWVKAHGNSGGN